ncbi:MAG: hypothetical protein AAF414_19650 [Pseudomonadota bacterium]
MRTTFFHSDKSKNTIVCAVLLGAVTALAACQSNGKRATGPLTPGQAQAAFYACLDNAFDEPVLATGGDRATANRFINRCSGELADWEDALVQSGMPPEQADEQIDTLRDNLRDDIADNLSGPI